MRTLSQPNKFVVNALGEQTPEDGVNYRRSRYTIRDGERWFNTLTGEAIDSPTDAELVRRWFYVPQEIDEAGLAYIVRQKALLLQRRPGVQLASAVIFPTTGCNAHCEYCFEQGYKIMTMSEQTAKDAAAWISAKCNHDKGVRLRWFGGEPLTNVPAINAIVNSLDADGVPFQSDIFTNGDLLPLVSDDDIKRWRLWAAQLTCDDVGAEYDRIKGLPPGAFARILEQAARLRALGVRVTVRTHYRGDPDACIRVAKAFKGIPGVSVYCMMLYGTGHTDDYDGLLKVEDYLINHGLMRLRFPKILYGRSCMADDPAIACITPDGHLSPCEHYAYGEDYGSIYEKGVDLSILRKWSEKSRNAAGCTRCPLYPMCGRLKLCPGQGVCTPEQQYYQIKCIKRTLRGLKHD